MFKALIHKLFKHSGTVPEQAYDLWATSYDSQLGNLMLTLDEAIFSSLLNSVAITNKTVVDVGCGTGRHWNKIFQQRPLQLTGYDVSDGMLKMLKTKFPDADFHKLSGNQLSHTADNTTDILISTLTIAHIKNIGAALQEWNRVLKVGADILITDYHPAILKQGGKRTFSYNNKTVAIINHTHSIEKIRSLAGALNWTTIQFEEKKIDDEVKHFYEKKGAAAIYELYKGLPVIYGFHFKKER